MAKQKTVYFCSQCGHESSKWMGQCPACKQWNTFTEEKVTETKKGGAKSLKTSASPMNISEVTIENEERIPTGIGELDRVLGGGIVKGSLSLVGGDPGIGKSTLLYRYAEILRIINARFYIFLGKNRCIRSRCVLRELEHLKKKCFFFVKQILMRSPVRF